MAGKHVRWAFNFSKWNPSEQDVLLATACIQQEEKERLTKFVFKKDFKSSLIGRLMMRNFVHNVTSFPYNKIKFGRDEKGKPILLLPNLNTLRLAFNVSHQGNFVVLAGEVENNTVGVDVMKLEYSGGKSVSEFFRIMNRQFSNEEWVEIKNGGSKTEQLAMFYRHWCLKESYVKAIGVGITVNLQDITFKTNLRHLRKDIVTVDSKLFVENCYKNWTFEETLIDDEHCVAVALYADKECPVKNSCFIHLEFSDIIKNAIPILDFDENYCKSYLQKPEAP